MSHTNQPYIDEQSNIRGGNPVITGTGIRVIDIAIEHVYKGYSVDQIIDYHPHLELKHVHAALSYYYENQQKIDQQIRDDRKRIELLKKEIASRSSKLKPKYA